MIISKEKQKTARATSCPGNGQYFPVRDHAIRGSLGTSESFQDPPRGPLDRDISRGNDDRSFLEPPVAHVCCQSRMFRARTAHRRKRVIPICPIIVAVMLILNQRRRSPRFASACVSCKFGRCIRNVGQHGVESATAATIHRGGCERELAERDSESGVARGRRRNGNAAATMMIGLVEIRFSRTTRPARGAAAL